MRNDHLDLAVSFFRHFRPHFVPDITNQLQGGDRESGNSSAEGSIGKDTEVR